MFLNLQPPAQKSGCSADIGSSLVASTPTSDTEQIQSKQLSLHKATPPTKPQRTSPSATIIETCLLGDPTARPAELQQPQPVKAISSSSTTASMRVATNQKQQLAKQAVERRDSLENAKERQIVCGLSPRLEMRLALNHDILGDEDLICYDPGPDLTTILG